MKTMLKFCLIFYTTFCVTFNVVWGENFLKEKPDWLNQCDLSDTDMESCLTTNYQNMYRMLATGIPGLTALKTIEPIRVNSLEIDESGSPSVNIKIKLKDVDIYGFGTTQMEYAKFEKNIWKTRGLVKKWKLVGDYEVDGRILVIPLVGAGKVVIEATDVDMAIGIKVNLTEREGYTFHVPKAAKFDYRMKGLKINMDNLFNGNEELTAQTNRLLSENWESVNEAMKPSLIKASEQVILSTMTLVFDFIPANHFFAKV